jgi:hypothetical protein
LKTFVIIFLAASLLIACGGRDKKEGDSKVPETKTEATTTGGGSATKLEGVWEIKELKG